MQGECLFIKLIFLVSILLLGRGFSGETERRGVATRRCALLCLLAICADLLRRCYKVPWSARTASCTQSGVNNWLYVRRPNVYYGRSE